jgi:succinyl-CoA synthetase beta subunit
VGALRSAVPSQRPVEVRAAVGGAAIEPGYWAARTLLADVGVPFPHGVQVHPGTELTDAAKDLQSPLVLKAGWLEHKSEVGGVRTQLDASALHAAFDDMRTRLGDGEYVVEEQDTRPDAVEMLIAARRDPHFGAVVVVGAGGTETEIHKDIRMACAPVSRATATEMLDGLRCAPLLHGWRGRPAVDMDKLADLVVVVSQLIAGRDDIAEVELNPVRVTATGPLAVDALVVNT